MASWRAGEEVEVAASLLGLFPLLAKTSVSFLGLQGERANIIQMVFELEEKLPPLVAALAAQATQSASSATSSSPGTPQPYPHPTRAIIGSPYRPPLYRFFSRHAPDALGMLLSPKSIVDSSLVALLIGALKSSEGQGLIDEFASDKGIGEERLIKSLTLVLQAEEGQTISPTSFVQAAVVRANAARVASTLCQVMPGGENRWDERPLMT